MDDKQMLRFGLFARFGYALLIAVLLGLLACLGWQAGETSARQLDAQMRVQLLGRAEDIARAINPELARKLTFTAADKGTPAFEYIRSQMINASKTGRQRGIYSMALRDGKIVFGPESYPENDPQASPAGTVYKKPSQEDWLALQIGKPATAGPFMDEYGTFVSAIYPVVDPHSGKVLLVVGVDILAADWMGRLDAARRGPLLITLLAMLLLAVGAVATGWRNRLLKPEALKLKRWIIVPTVVAMLAGLALYGGNEYQGYLDGSRQAMLGMTARTKMLWHRNVASQVLLLRAQIDAIAGNPEMLQAWKSRNAEALSALAQPKFEQIRREYGITHFYFITPERTCFLRVHQPGRRGDSIDRATLLSAQSTGADSWGVELGPLGSFTLRYVRPLIQGGAMTGYVELGMELDHLAGQLAGDMGLDFMTVIRKACTTREKFEAGRTAFHYDGNWDTYPDFVVAHQSLSPLPDGVDRWLEHGHLSATGSQVFTARQAEKQFACGVIHLLDAAGRNAAALILLHNVTGQADAAWSNFLMNLALALVLFCSLVLLLWSLTGTAQRQLDKAFSSVQESESLFRGLFENAIFGFALHKIIVDEQGNPVDYIFLQANPAFEVQTGLRVADVLGRRGTEVFAHVKDLPFIDIYGQVTMTGKPVSCQGFVEPLQRYYTISSYQAGPGRFATLLRDITARKLAEEKIQLNEARLQSLVKIFQYRSDNVQDFLDFALSEAISLTASQFGYIYFYDEEKREFILNSWSRDVMEACSVIGQQTVYELDTTGLWGEAVRQRRPIMVNDFKAPNPLSKGYPEGHVPLHSFLTVPIISGERIVALIGVANKAADYDETDILQLTLLMDAVWKISESRQAEAALKVELEERRQVENALRESESLLAEAQQRAHIGTWTLNFNTGEQRWSDEVNLILGRPAGSPLNFEVYSSYFHPDDFPDIAYAWGSPDVERTSLEIQYRIIRPSGEIRHVQVYTIYRYSDDGEILSFATMIIDITERKLAEEALKAELAERKRIEAELRASESLLTEAQQMAHIGTWIYDFETQQFSWSDEINRILGLPAGTPMTYSELARHVHPDDYAGLVESWSGLTSECPSIVHEYRVIRPGGEIRNIYEYCIYKYDGGQLVSSAALLLDITERKLAEDKLRQLSQAVEQSPALIVITDTQGNIEYVNPKFVHTTGYAPEEVLGKNPRLLKSGNMPPDDYRELWETITAGREWHGEFSNKKKNGELYWEGASISPIRAADGRITHFLAVKEDITQRKRAEEELRDANRQLEASIARANDMALQAELANMAKSEFLANMSHEIRTPMNGVIGMTGLLLDTDLTSEQRQYAQIVRSSGESLLGLINDILDLSKIEAGKLDLEALDFDLRATMEDSAELLSVKAAEKKLELVCLVDPDVPVLLRGDPGRLRQVFMNLGGNAVKFTEAGGITLRAKLDAEDEGHVTVRFSVTDTGIGIPRNKQAIIFSPFTQADGSTTRKYGGTGLGLSISKRLAELMGGAIGLESEPRKGSTFWFTAVFEKQPAGRLAASAPMADLTGVRVLVVDDHGINRLLITTLLKSWGCRFAEAVDAEGAIERLYGAVAQKDPYSIALLDMHMPGVNGAELGRRIKLSPEIAATHLIMMSSLSERGDAARFMALGFEGYLNKPLRQGQLHDCMAMVLGKARLRQEQGGASQLVTRHTISEARKRRVRILIAEDNATNQLVALKILEKLGYRADTVGNGAEAVAALREIPYDLVLMDCQMPELDGFDATRRIRNPRSEVLNHQVPVIAMTAHAMTGDREQCLEAGMDDYLSKPIEPAQLAPILERWLKDDDAEGPRPETGPAPEQEAAAGNRPAVFEKAVFYARLLDDEDMIQLIIDTFLEDIPVQIEKLAAAVAAGDCVQAGQLGHRIKGAAANMAAEALRAAAAAIEQASKAGDIEELRGLQPALERCFAELKEVLRSLVFGA